MNFERIQQKLQILADAAKYDVSCASSGSSRKNTGGLGNGAKNGICHTFTSDGRCVALLKLLLTNHCIYDCAYCVSRSSNDVQRAAFTVDEVVDLTLHFYRRNYIEGLFLSSGIFKDADTTMERLLRVAQKLRIEHNFQGYIHLKAIPGASEELMKQAGRYADRLSVNMEIPTKSGLQLLAPEKNHDDMIAPMTVVRDEIVALDDTRKNKLIRSTPKFAPAGQSTQFIVGATPETDQQMIRVASHFYQEYKLRRVYYSGYVPVLADQRLPSPDTAVPVLRENRLYQADWLMRFYGFGADEILDADQPFLDLELDPKLAWAVRHRDYFPVPVQTATREQLLRVPGFGRRTVDRILHGRRQRHLSLEHLKNMGAVVSRARFFIKVAGDNPHAQQLDRQDLRAVLLGQIQQRRQNTPQLALF